MSGLITKKKIARAMRRNEIRTFRNLPYETTAEPTVIEFYPRLLLAAVVLAGIGMLFMRGRTDLWLQCAAAVVALAVVARVLA